MAAPGSSHLAPGGQSRSRPPPRLPSCPPSSCLGSPMLSEQLRVEIQRNIAALARRGHRHRRPHRPPDRARTPRLAVASSPARTRSSAAPPGSTPPSPRSALRRWCTGTSGTATASRPTRPCARSPRARVLLTAGRCPLNFLQLLSGTATVTRRFVDAVAGTLRQDRRHPQDPAGLRLAQKYAVAIGGGTNHRVGLYDGILIKENHIIAAAASARWSSRAHDRALERVHRGRGRDARATARGARCRREDDPARQHDARADARGGGNQRRPCRTRGLGWRQSRRVRAIAETGVDRISIGTPDQGRACARPVAASRGALRANVSGPQSRPQLAERTVLPLARARARSMAAAW